MKVRCSILLAVPLALAEVSVWAQPRIARGERLFAQGCAVGYCHGAGGSAGRGPRLRGRAFDREYLLRVIRVGIPNTAMPAWGDRLTDPDIEALADYVQSLANAPADIAGPPPADTASGPPSDRIQEIPEEHRKGRELFFDLNREARCSVCHRLAGIGTAAGPNVTRAALIGNADGPRVLKYGRPRTVRTVVLHSGERSPAVIVESSASFTKAYFLSIPPVLRNLMKSEIASIQRQTSWRHLDAVRAYTAAELQAIWNYVRWVAGRN